MNKPPPYDPVAEAALLGALLLHPDHIPEVSSVLVAEDFYVPANAAVFDALVAMWAHGAGIDVVTVHDHLKREGQEIPPADLISLQSGAGIEWRRYTDIVARHALSRRVLGVSVEMGEAAREGRNEQARRLATDLFAEPPVGTRPPGLTLGEELLAAEVERPTPWVIPGLLREAWRAMLVGIEGYGKSSVLYQLAVMASYGQHPFHYGEIEAVPTLVLDFENDAADVRTMTESMVMSMIDKGIYSAGWHVWRPPTPVDLRRPTTRRAVEAILRDVRPRLVCLGPLYRAYRRSAKESDEDAAAEVQPILDDWRARYGFALVIEHHAPKGGASAMRELDPFGSSLWMRWPDLGYKLVPLDDRDRPTRERTGRLGVWDFRGARKMASWPTKLEWRGRPIPWVGTAWPPSDRADEDF